GVTAQSVSTAAVNPALSLQAAEGLIAERNRDVLLARRTAAGVDADVLTAGARPNPNLSFGLSSINPSAGIGAGTPRDKAIDQFIRLDQLIERGGKRELRIDAAKGRASAARSDVNEIVRQQRLAVGLAYYDLLLAQDRTRITAETLELYGNTLAAADRRLKAGDIAPADVSRIRVDALRAETDARTADADRVRAQLALASLLAAEPQARDIQGMDPWPDAAAAMAPADVDAQIAQRADVRAAAARLEAARVARDLARSLRTRDVSVGAQFDRYPTSGSNQLGSGNSFGVSMSLPLFWRYGFEGEISRAEADYTLALDTVERARAVARADVARAYAELNSFRARVERYDRAVLPEARRSAEFAEFAYKNGAIGVMDLLDARRVLRATQLEASQARADHAKARVALRAAAATEPVQP
ncbi:MAG: TolC family protein, partial [Burkholderiales bacterium]